MHFPGSCIVDPFQAVVGRTVLELGVSEGTA
jgi:hypothetical protein